MRLKYKFEIMDIDDDKIAIPIEENTHILKGVIKLNGTAAEIFELLELECSEEDIVTKLSEKYSSSTREDISEYVYEFVKELKREKLLV